MRKHEWGAIIGIVVLVVLLVVGIYRKVFPMDSVLTNGQWFIYAGIVGLFVWGFRERIESWFHRDDIKPSLQSIDGYIHNDNVGETKPLLTQPITNNGIQHYENRSQLPFDEMISKAEQKVEMSAITFRILTLSYYKILRGILSRRVHITFLLLSPESSSISVQREIYHAAYDLEKQIRDSLEELCKLRREFKDLIEIRLYHSLSEHSIIIIDRDNPDKAWIKIESRPVGSDSNSRQSDVAYRKDNQTFFEEHCREYDLLLQHSKRYECHSTPD